MNSKYKYLLDYGKNMRKTKSIHGLMLLAFLAYCPLTFGVDVNIAGETIRLPAPNGFTEVKSFSQDTFSMFEEMYPSQSRLLAVFVTQSDAGKLIRGDDADLSEYITVHSVKKLEDETLTKYEFRELRDMLRKEYDSLVQSQEESIDQAITQAGSALSKRLDTDVEFNLNGFAPLGVDAETTSSISISQLTKYDMSMYGENIQHTAAGSMTAALVKGKVLYLNVFRTYQDQEDVDWVRSQSEKWLPTIVSANENIWPTTKRGIIPEGTPIDAGTKELMSETQVEYNMKLHPKAHGLDISIKYPESWKAQEAIRPHIVQNFKGESVAGISTSLMLHVQKLPTWATLLVESELGEETLSEYLHEMVPPGATYIDGGATKIDGESGLWIKFYYPVESAGVRVGMYGLQYMFLYDGKMVSIQCYVGGLEEDKEMLEDAFASYLPLFQMIGNSTVIHDKWVQSDHYSFREHVTGWSTVIIFLVFPAIIALGFGVIRPKKNPSEPL